MEKMKVYFSRIFDNPLKDILPLKKFLVWIGFFGLLIRGSRTSFQCVYSAYFFIIKKFLMQYSISWPSFNTRLWLFPNISNFNFELLFRHIMISWTLTFIFNQLLLQWPAGKWREENGNKNSVISREQKELFTVNKKIFFRFLKLHRGHYL